LVVDLVKHADDIKADRQAFLLSPRRWRTSKVQVPLAWKSVKFEAANRPQVPAIRGVYAFIVQHVNGHFPPHGYIMYIGITGDVSATRTLNDRYYEYLVEKRKQKRAKIAYMLNKYADDLYFTYATITDPNFDLGKLELELNDAVIPPVVVKDFTAEIREIVRAIF
jgi:hypothetical protein